MFRTTRMFRMTFTSLLLVVFVVRANAQQYQNQNPNQNLFPGDPSVATVVQAANTGVNTLYDGAQQATQETLRQVDQAAQQTISVANETADATTKSWSRFLPPPQTGTSNLVERWNTGTRNFLHKTKQVLTPPPIDKPLIPMPKLDSNLNPLRNVKLPSLPKTRTPQKKRSLLPAIFSRQQPPPPKPTVQDFLGQERLY